MTTSSYQHVLDRVRPPRVQITYDVETGGAIQTRELPFVGAILADLAGGAHRAAAVGAELDYYPSDDLSDGSEPVLIRPRAALHERVVRDVDSERLDACVRQIAPVFSGSLSSRAAVELDGGAIRLELTEDLRALEAAYGVIAGELDGDADAARALVEASPPGVAQRAVALELEAAGALEAPAAEQYAVAALAASEAGLVQAALAALTGAYDGVAGAFEAALDSGDAGEALADAERSLAAQLELAGASAHESPTDADAGALAIEHLDGWRAQRTVQQPAQIVFQQMADFDPGRVLRQLPRARELLRVRESLLALNTKLEGAPDLAAALQITIERFSYASLQAPLRRALTSPSDPEAPREDSAASEAPPPDAETSA